MKCCVSTDVGTWTNWLTFEPDLDYSPDARTGLLSPILCRLSHRITFVGGTVQVHALHWVPSSYLALSTAWNIYKFGDSVITHRFKTLNTIKSLIIFGMRNWNWIKFGEGFCWAFLDRFTQQNPPVFCVCAWICEACWVTGWWWSRWQSTWEMM